jgi:exodeoxyribonuclease VII large subunit
VVNTLYQKLDDRTERLQQAFTHYFDTINLKFKTTSKLLKSYSYHSILNRGFALISGPSNKIITQSHVAANQNRLQILFADGQINVVPLNKKALQKLKNNYNSNTSSIQGNLFNE